MASRETGLEVIADNTRYVVMSRDQKAGRNQIMNVGNISFERVGEFKYLGTTLNKKSIQIGIKS